jgi:hypothetical protein
LISGDGVTFIGFKSYLKQRHLVMVGHSRYTVYIMPSVSIVKFRRADILEDIADGKHMTNEAAETIFV